MKRIGIGAAALLAAGIAAAPAGAADYGMGGPSAYRAAPSRPLFDEGMPAYGVVVVARPAYIGRGLVYNVPPEPGRAYGYGYGEGLRVRY